MSFILIAMNNLAIGDRVVDDSNYLGIAYRVIMSNRNGGLHWTHLSVQTDSLVDRRDLGPAGAREKQRVALRCNGSPCLLLLRSSLWFLRATRKAAQVLLDSASISNQVGLPMQIKS